MQPLIAKVNFDFDWWRLRFGANQCSVSRGRLARLPCVAHFLGIIMTSVGPVFNFAWRPSVRDDSGLESLNSLVCCTKYFGCSDCPEWEIRTDQGSVCSGASATQFRERYY